MAWPSVRLPWLDDDELRPPNDFASARQVSAKQRQLNPLLRSVDGSMSRYLATGEANDRGTGKDAVSMGAVGSSASTELLYRRKRHPANAPPLVSTLLAARGRGAMEIGDPRRTVTVEPLEEPVPRELPDEPPEEEPAELPREPEKAPA